MSEIARNHWDAAGYDERHSYVSRHGTGLIELLAARPAERILDLGCGTGHLAAQIAATGAEVVGVDSAPSMIQQARRNYPHLRFEVADGTDFSFAEPFDAVFSNAAIHWMRPPERVVECVSRALAPGGRFVAEFGGKGNVQMILNSIHTVLRRAGDCVPEERNPWYFPSIAEYTSLLEGNGLSVRLAVLFERRTLLDGGEEGMRNWLDMFAGSFLSSVPLSARTDVIAAVEDGLRSKLFRDDAWYADYMRLRVVAIKE
ncbi:MAG: methyltransferase domain-containing protein [Chloroflexota bacterium]|nr:methyltransferase domain-containing protein [Chloroflexota bacterium]